MFKVNAISRYMSILIRIPLLNYRHSTIVKFNETDEIYIYIYIYKCILYKLFSYIHIWMTCELSVRCDKMRCEFLRSLVDRYALRCESGETFDPVLRVYNFAVALPLNLQAILQRQFRAFQYGHFRQSDK